MKKQVFLLIFSFAFWLAQSQPVIHWQKSIGGSNLDAASSILPTDDGGYVIAGGTFSNNGDVSINKGNGDCWVVKLTSIGDIEWEKSFGGTNQEFIYAIQTTIDSGYVFAGFSESNNLDVSGNYGGRDFWVVKLSKAGEIQWEKNLGGTWWEEANSIMQTEDSGFVIAGYSESIDIDVTDNHGNKDFWVVKLNEIGEIQWKKSYGGSGQDIANSIQQTSDNGYIVVGMSSSNNGDVTGNHGNRDCWVIKLSETGELIWQKTLGGSAQDWAYFVELTDDGGYVLASESASSDGNVTVNQGSQDFWIVKLTQDGEIQWQKSLGGTNYDSARQIHQTQDGNFIVFGDSNSNEGDISFNHGLVDCWVVKLTNSGDIIWEKSYGGSVLDEVRAIQENADGSFIMAGMSQSNDGDVSGNHGDKDFWVTKLFFPPSSIIGRIHYDINHDCQQDTSEYGLSRWLIQAVSQTTFSTITNIDGYFFIPVENGSYEVNVIPIGPNWATCNGPYTVNISDDTLTLDFPVQAITDCPYLTVDISAPFLRRCFENNYYVHYCNDGTATANDATVEVTLDPYLTYVSSTLPLASQNGSTLTFNIGDVAVGDCGNFQITTMLDCASTVLGQTHCTSAHITPDSLCLPPDPLWNGSSIEVDVNCNGDSVVFTITNVGTGGMPAPLGYIIIEDQIVLLTEDFQLGPGMSTTVTLPSNGSTFHLEAQQAAAHPSGFASTGATIEGCGGWFSLGWFTQWSFDDDPDPFTDVDCQSNIGSYDPNDKQGFSAGFTEEHLIEPGQDIEYLIRFQNTGTDTAFKVTVVDVLPPELDLASVRPGASSHPYTYGVTPEGWPTFTFDNILLPDSMTNEAASHGFVRFRASQRPGLGWGDTIANTALIYFDFNAPVQTNTYKHRIGQVFPWSVVGTTPPVFQPKSQVRIMPNPLTDSAILQIEGIEPGLLKLVLTDVSGKILRQRTVNGIGFEFQRGELNPGLYFFQIERDGEQVGSGKLMVR